MRLNLFFLLRARSSKSGTCLGVVLSHPSDKAFHETRAVSYRFVTRAVFTERCQSIGSGSGVALRQCTVKPAIGYALDCARVFSVDFIDQSVPGAGIGFPIKFHLRPRHFRFDAVWFDRERSVQDGLFLGIAAKMFIASRRL